MNLLQPSYGHVPERTNGDDGDSHYGTTPTDGLPYAKTGLQYWVTTFGIIKSRTR